MSLSTVYPEAIMFLDIEVFSKYGNGFWAQEMFLVHGHDDVMWTSDIDEALRFIRQSLEYAKIKIEKNEEL